MFSGFLQLSPTDVRKTNEGKLGITLGTLGATRDGRVYRWSKNGAVALAHGKLNTNAAVDANVVNVQVAFDAKKGSTSVIVEAGGTVLQDAYADGSLTVSDAAGEGYTYLIVGNTGVTGAGNITVGLAEPLEADLTGNTSEVTLEKSIYDSVVVAPASVAHAAAGVNNVDVSAGYNFWGQVWGSASVLSQGAITRGALATISATVNGAAAARSAATQAVVGVAQNATVDTEYRAVQLTIG